jgi:hypothetical protein
VKHICSNALGRFAQLYFGCLPASNAENSLINSEKKIDITQQLINDRLFSKVTQVLNYINVPALSTAHVAYSLR